MNVSGGCNESTKHELLNAMVDSHSNGIVKVEVKKELDCSFVNVQNPDLDDGVHKYIFSEPKSVCGIERDPLGTINTTHIQNWPKIEFREVVHEFNPGSTELPYPIEELNNIHTVEPIHNTPSTSKHFSMQENVPTNSIGCGNIGLYVKGREASLMQKDFSSYKLQDNFAYDDSDPCHNFEMTDQDYSFSCPVIQSLDSMNGESIMYSDVDTTSKSSRDADASNATKVIGSYLKRGKDKYTCKLCNKRYVDIEKCKGHISSHLGLKPHACTEANCTKAFPSKEALRSHVYLIHKARNRFKCEMCDKTFNKRYLYVEHCNKHNAVMPFDCAECGKTFPSKDSIFVHIVDVHNISTGSHSSLCPHCGKVFNNHQKLKCHLRTHGEKRFVCEICNAKFRSRFKLANHKASHSTERPFHCNLCTKTYRLNTTLRRHVVTAHEKKKNFKCTTCGKSFVTGTFLREHVLKHEGVRKYSCETCGKTFAQASHLAAHQFSHGEKKFVCPLCGAKFNRHDNMKSHVKRHENKVKK